MVEEIDKARKTGPMVENNTSRRSALVVEIGYPHPHRRESSDHCRHAGGGAAGYKGGGAGGAMKPGGAARLETRMDVGFRRMEAGFIW